MRCASSVVLALTSVLVVVDLPLVMSPASGSLCKRNRVASSTSARLSRQRLPLAMEYEGQMEGHNSATPHFCSESRQNAGGTARHGDKRVSPTDRCLHQASSERIALLDRRCSFPTSHQRDVFHCRSAPIDVVRFGLIRYCLTLAILP